MTVIADFDPAVGWPRQANEPLIRYRALTDLKAACRVATADRRNLKHRVTVAAP